MGIEKDFTQASSGAAEYSGPHSWMKNMASAHDTGKPNIVIVIDDVTSSTVGKVINAVGKHQITMAFMPDYSVQDNLDQAKRHGHDTLIHMPMEPLDDSIKLDKSALRAAFKPNDVNIVFRYAIDYKNFHGFIGINNHMGSAAMQSPDLMDGVMREMNKRDLLFLDSYTVPIQNPPLLRQGIENSEVAKTKAEEHGVDYVRRKVFLDDTATPDAVRGELSKLEAIAEQEGSAIAIGHPKGVTMEALKEWMDEASEKFDFIPLGTHAATELDLVPKLGPLGHPSPSSSLQLDP